MGTITYSLHKFTISYRFKDDQESIENDPKSSRPDKYIENTRIMSRTTEILFSLQTIALACTARTSFFIK